MNNFTDFITPDEAAKMHNELNPHDQRTVEYFRKLSEDSSICPICETERVWRFGQCGMCFSCTTGEADASDDYELIGGNDGKQDTSRNGT